MSSSVKHEPIPQSGKRRARIEGSRFPFAQSPDRPITQLENYFNYFTEIEERFQRRRGTTLLLSTLDWALIETWKDAGIALEAALRGIDDAFDKYQRKVTAKTQKVNSLAYCAQAVLAAAEEMKEAAVGAARESGSDGEPEAKTPPGFSAAEVKAFLERSREALLKSKVPAQAASAVTDAATSLAQIAEGLDGGKAPRLEDLERRLTVLEERIYAALTAAASEQELLAVRTEADRQIGPYRSKMSAPQIEQLHRQFVHKRLLENAGLPRLSLFYM